MKKMIPIMCAALLLCSCSKSNVPIRETVSEESTIDTAAESTLETTAVETVNTSETSVTSAITETEPADNADNEIMQEFDEEVLCAKARYYYIRNNNGISPEYVEIDHVNKDGTALIHLYDYMRIPSEDFGMTSTCAWFIVDPLTGKGRDDSDNEIDLNIPLCGGYSYYVTSDSEADEFTMHICDGISETDSMKINDMIISPEAPRFYGKEMPPCFVLEETGTSEPLNFRTYFIINGKVKEALWYIDGEKQTCVNYTLLHLYGTDEGFNAYSPFEGELKKYSFAFDIDTLTFDGVSRNTVQSGCAGTAQELMDNCYGYIMGAYSAETDEYNNDFLLLSEAGYRSREKIIGGLEKYCGSYAAEALFELYFGENSDFMEKDGKMLIYDSAWSNMPPTHYVDLAEEKDGLILARIYSYAYRQDRPHYISEPTYASFEQIGGEWKIGLPPEMWDETVCYF